MIEFNFDILISGLNCGRYIESFLKLLHPKNSKIFQLPRIGKKFLIHKNKTTQYYCNSKVGRHFVAEMMPKLSAACGVPRLTNNQIRPYVIRSLKRAGFEDRVITTLSGHKRIATLINYDPAPEVQTKNLMAKAIMAPKLRKTVVSETVTSTQIASKVGGPSGQVSRSTITKSVSKESVFRLERRGKYFVTTLDFTKLPYPRHF